MALRYSIVVPFYQGIDYIEQCISSVLSQDFDSVEVIIVDDCDQNNSGAALDSLYKDEPRVKIIHHKENRGTLQTRRDGVLASTGEYVMLMDQDDTLAPGALVALERELANEAVDILHFAAHVIAENEAAEDARLGMQAFLTPIPRKLIGEEILKYQFAQQDGFDWQVNHKVYAGDFARKAWEALGDICLSRADDVYASFVLCTFASSYRAVDGTWYEYHLGRGDTFGVGYDINEFKRWCDADVQAYAAVAAFACVYGSEFPCSKLDERAGDVRDLMAEHSMNELIDNLSMDDWSAAIEYLRKFWPADVIAAELWRFVRDRSYALLTGEERLGSDDVLFKLLENAKQLDAAVEGEGTKRYRAMRKLAICHTVDLEHKLGSAEACASALAARNFGLVRARDYEAQPIRIFVSTHKDAAMFQSDILQPVQLGAKEYGERFLWAYQDSSNNPLALHNEMYCELTAQYWAWKNIDASYYGFCHYRRYFDFSTEEHAENPWGEIAAGRINYASQMRYGLDDATIAEAVEGWDVVTTRIKDVHKFPEHFKSMYEHYRQAPYLKIEHLEHIISILTEEHPDYERDAKAYLHDSKSCFCNMYIMRKELFEAYCAWLFPLLERFVAEWDTSTLSKEALRTPGHLAERLFNIWLLHEKRVNPGLKHKQLQCVRFEHPEPYTAPVLHAIKDVKKPVIPVVFAADNNYVPMLTTAVYSLLKNASSEYFYDIVAMESNITDENKSEMLEFFSQFDNMALRFARVDGMVDEYGLQTNNEHIGIETYYRFLTQKVLPDYDKVLYLDSDLVVEADISELYAVEIGDNLIGAVRDADYLGNLNMNDGIRMRYSKEVLGMNNPYDYFQAGVLIMNLEQMRMLYSTEQWLKYASETKYIFDDQDILNAHCEGRVVFLDNAWNAMNDCMGRIQKVCSFAPAAVYDEYLAAYAAPKIVHFAGCEKPWKPGSCDKAELYWEYASETPFYKQQVAFLLEQIAKHTDDALRSEIDKIRREIFPEHESVLSEDNSLRILLDGVFPMGSRRREVAKAIGRFLTGKK